MGDDADSRVLANREHQVVHCGRRPCLLLHANFDVKEAPRHVVGAQPVGKLFAPRFRRFVEVQRRRKLREIEGVISIKGGNQARPCVDVDVHVGKGSLIAHRMPHERAHKAMRPKHVGQVSVSLSQCTFVRAVMPSNAILVLELADLFVDTRVNHEDSLGHSPCEVWDDVEGQHHLIGRIRVYGLRMYGRQRVAALGIELRSSRFEDRKHWCGNLSADPSTDRVECVAEIEHAAGDPNGRNQAPRKHVDAQNNTTSVVHRLNVRLGEDAGAEKVAHDKARGVWAKQVTPWAAVSFPEYGHRPPKVTTSIRVIGFPKSRVDGAGPNLGTTAPDAGSSPARIDFSPGVCPSGDAKARDADVTMRHAAANDNVSSGQKDNQKRDAPTIPLDFDSTSSSLPRFCARLRDEHDLDAQGSP